MFKVDKKATEPQWIKFDEDESVELLIRPLSLYYFQKLPSGDIQLSSDQFGKLFCQLLVDWKGIYESDDVLMPCTDENKLLVADHAQNIASFVISKASDLKGKIATIGEKASKN